MSDRRASLVVTDLDGTLWHTDDRLHPDTGAALRRLHEGGTPLLVATGRRRGSTSAPLHRFGLRPPAIVLNGALGVDLATGRRFHHAPFPTGAAVAVLDAFRAAGLDPCVYVDGDDHEVYLSATPSTSPLHVEQLGADAATADLAAVVEGAEVLAFSIIGRPHGDLVRAAEKLDGVAEVHLDRSFDHPGMATITVAPPGQSKWDGVVAFCAERGLDPGCVVALGDGPNDVELLEAAAVALVPENAHPAALAVADVVIAPPDAGGWAEVLDHL